MVNKQKMAVDAGMGGGVWWLGHWRKSGALSNCSSATVRPSPVRDVSPKPVEDYQQPQTGRNLGGEAASTKAF